MNTPTFIEHFREAGLLRRRQGQPVTVPYQVRLLTLADLEPLCQLHHRILSELPAPHLLRPNKPEFFVRHLKDAGYSLGVFVEDKLIGYAVLGLAPESVATFGADLNLSSAELALAAHLDGVALSRVATIICIGCCYPGESAWPATPAAGI
ncbi:MAG: hypothetical protein R3F37_17790 [Candidatus Competibacteraceae bacterium]